MQAECCEQLPCTTSQVLSSHWPACSRQHWALFGVITVTLLAAEGTLIKVVGPCLVSFLGIHLESRPLVYVT